jgi:hypothetical protein
MIIGEYTGWRGCIKVLSGYGMQLKMSCLRFRRSGEEKYQRRFIMSESSKLIGPFAILIAK